MICCVRRRNFENIGLGHIVQDCTGIVDGVRQTFIPDPLEIHLVKVIGLQVEISPDCAGVGGFDSCCDPPIK